jgi:hypothetical protein
MIRKYRNIISLALAIHILLSSVGVALHIRHCQMPEMGKSISVFIPEQDHCCAKKKASHCAKTNQRKPVNPCCEFKSDFFKTDYNTPLSASLSLDFQVFVGVIELPFSYQPTHLLIFNQLEPDFYTDVSPPASGRQILLQKNTLLI